MERTWPLLLNQLVDRVDLSQDDTAWAMDQVMSGAATPAQIARGQYLAGAGNCIGCPSSQKRRRR